MAKQRDTFVMQAEAIDRFGTIKMRKQCLFQRQSKPSVSTARLKVRYLFSLFFHLLQSKQIIGFDSIFLESDKWQTESANFIHRCNNVTARSMKLSSESNDNEKLARLVQIFARKKKIQSTEAECITVMCRK